MFNHKLKHVCGTSVALCVYNIYMRGKNMKKLRLIPFALLSFSLSAGAVALKGVNKKQNVEVKADGAVSYVVRGWDSTNKVVTETTSSCDTYTPVTNSTTTWNAGWYVVNEDVTITSRISLNGVVNLILCDGKQLIADKGIRLLQSNTLNIFGQENDSGQIVATQIALSSDATIGGNSDQNTGTLNIYGGTILSIAPHNGAAIGSGAGHNSGNISIFGGNISVTHGGGAGIGSGQGGSVDNINIYGGHITTNGSTGNGAGIGAGVENEEHTSCGTINICGGTIEANAGPYAAAIGGDTQSYYGTINISGGTITANGDTEDGFGVGAAEHIYVSGGLLVATGAMGINGAMLGLTVTGGEIRTNPTGVYGISPSCVIFDIPGWYAVYGSDTENPPTTIMENVLGEFDRFNRCKYMTIRAHDHDWSYSAKGASITASCSFAGCQLDSGLTLKLVGQKNYVYDGKAKTVSFATGYNVEAFVNPEIKYYKGNVLVSECVDVGSYEARVTVGGATAKLAFTISKNGAGPNGGGLGAGAVVGIVLGSLVFVVGAAYLVLFFLLNKWIKVGDKAVRVLRFALGKKDGTERYLAFPCKFAYRNKEEVFNTKQDALK